MFLVFYIFGFNSPEYCQFYLNQDFGLVMYLVYISHLYNIDHEYLFQKGGFDDDHQLHSSFLTSKTSISFSLNKLERFINFILSHNLLINYSEFWISYSWNEYTWFHLNIYLTPRNFRSLSKKLLVKAKIWSQTYGGSSFLFAPTHSGLWREFIQ